MPCYYPLQATFSIRPDGKKDIKFSTTNAKRFVYGLDMLGDSISLPCGRCMGCRLERSRQWAVRIMHEAQLHEDNCFVTLTFDDDHLVKMCGDNLSLNRKHMQNFMKRLRQKFSDRKIRAFYCGEYGDLFSRPHYHACLFGYYPSDRKFWRKIGDFNYYNSAELSDVWPFGHSVVSDLTFDSAAYVARYCTKKITGSAAKEHYQGRLPEFCQASLKPGIGRGWLEKFGKSDCFVHDQVIVNGGISKPPRYYDKYFESVDPEGFSKVREAREERALEKAGDNTHKRLLVKEACLESRLKCLIRKLEKGSL